MKSFQRRILKEKKDKRHGIRHISRVLSGFGPASQTSKPQAVKDIEHNASLHITTGPVDTVDWAPPPAEGGTNVKQWDVFTDIDALFFAHQAGFNVSIHKSPVANQAEIYKALPSTPPSRLTGITQILAAMLTPIITRV